MKTPSIKVPVSVRLFVFFFIILVGTTLPLFFLTNHSLKDLGKFAITANTLQIQKMTNDYLATIAREKAQKYDEFFFQIKTAATFLALRAGEAYRDMDTGRSLHDRHPSMIPNRKNNIFFSPESEPVITAFWGSNTLSSKITAELHALAELDPYLTHAKKRSAKSLAAHIITVSGIGKYYTEDPKARQGCFNLPSPDIFDIRNGEPVTTFTSQTSPDYRAKWTRLYKDDVINGMMLTATAPILDANGRFKGIAGIDVPLDNIIIDLLKDLPDLMKKPDHDSYGFAFLMGPQSELISFPFPRLGLFGLAPDTGNFTSSSDIFLVKLTDSTMPGVKHAAQRILDNPSTLLLTLKIDDQAYVMASHGLKQTGWHIVLVNSEKELLSSVQQTRQTLDKNLSDIVHTFLVYSCAVLLMALAFIYWTVRTFVRPIQQLTRLTRKISKNDYSVTVPDTRLDELGELARAFNQMIRQLNRSREREKAHTASLAVRTEQLKQLNEYLIYSEEIQRKTIAVDLHDSIAQTLAMGISTIKNFTEFNSVPRPNDLHEIQVTMEKAVHEIRTLIYKLSPPILDDFTIDIAIGFLVEDTNEKKHTAFSYINHIEYEIPVSHALKITLYRAVNELLTNIQKHASSNRAQITLSATDDHITLQVEDHGIGMDVKKLKNLKEKGFGLYSLSERIQHLGGSMTIESLQGRGTKITITAPLQTQETICDDVKTQM